jgi:transcriptional regulator with XRE-family HTH domain
LSAWQREQIRREYSEGIGQRTLADRFGVSPETIHKIVAGMRRAPTRDLLEEARERIRRAEERISAEAAALTSSEAASAEILAHDDDQEVWDV